MAVNQYGRFGNEIENSPKAAMSTTAMIRPKPTLELIR